MNEMQYVHYKKQVVDPHFNDLVLFVPKVHIACKSALEFL